MKARFLAITMLVLFLASCEKAIEPAQTDVPPVRSDLRLVLFLIVDQFRADYLDRFEPIYQNGISRLKEKGVLFLDAHHNHAVTTTAAGHATISTGTHPSRSGIISNRWFDRNRKTPMYCVEDDNWPLIDVDASQETGGRSPNNLQVSTLPDWMKKHWPDSKVFTASYKDRAAILLGGHAASSAYWYDTGIFVTSSYYQSKNPLWLQAFNAQKLPKQHFGKLWEPLPVNVATKKDLAIVQNNLGWFKSGFPHALGGRQLRPDLGFYKSFAKTPMIDQYLANFVKELILQEKIGQRDIPDYLGISFSALDIVGHEYGINSPELLDTLTRLDGIISNLLDFIDQKIGLNRTIIVFSSDHGVAPMPEYQKAYDLQGRRADDLDTICWQNLLTTISSRLGLEANWLLTDFYLDYQAIKETGLDFEKVEKVIKDVLEECPVIKRIWTRADLLAKSKDPFHRLFQNSFYPGRSPDLMPQLEEYQITTGRGSSHGSPYHYDTHVPILFVVPGIQAARIKKRVKTIDIAPTVADFLELSIPKHVQGNSLVHEMSGKADHQPK